MANESTAQAEKPVIEGQATQEAPAAEAPMAEAPAAETQESSEESSSVNWKDFLDDGSDEFESSDDEAPSDEAEAPKAEEVADEEKPAEEKPVEEKPAEEKPKAEEKPAEEKPPAEEPKTQTPEEQTEMRTKAHEELTKHFALTDEDAEAVKDNPAEVLPKIAAELYLQVYENVMNGVIAALPRMVQGVQQQTQAITSAEEKFYGRWDKLNTGEGKATVARLGAAYRQANPNTTLDDFIRDVGIQASIALQLPIEGYTAPQEIPEERSQPSRPPAGGASRPAVQSAASSNPFSAMAEEFIEDER
jgi:hypothetical protein